MRARTSNALEALPPLVDLTAKGLSVAIHSESNAWRKQSIALLQAQDPKNANFHLLSISQSYISLLALL